jgi:hypothetical protein
MDLNPNNITSLTIPQQKLTEFQALLSKSWLLFDLDDTLHSFRRASGTATSAALQQISPFYIIPQPALQSSYSAILTKGIAVAFMDRWEEGGGCRRESLAAVVNSFELVYVEECLVSLVEIYKSPPLPSPHHSYPIPIPSPSSLSQIFPTWKSQWSPKGHRMHKSGLLTEKDLKAISISWSQVMILV